MKMTDFPLIGHGNEFNHRPEENSLSGEAELFLVAKP
jgi:hypothetical protein